MSDIRLHDLKVEPGVPVLPMFEKLKRWAETFRMHKGDPRVRLTQNYGQGTWVSVVASEETWTPHFRVTVSGLTASVGMGTVNERVPMQNGVPLDGILDGEAVPTKPVKLDAPGENLRSWICLRASIDPKTKRLNPEDKEALTIIHATALQSPAEGIGLHPLALLIWNEGAGNIRTVHQITMHNLQHRYVTPDARLGRPGRHFFWPS